MFEIYLVGMDLKSILDFIYKAIKIHFNFIFLDRMSSHKTNIFYFLNL